MKALWLVRDDLEQHAGGDTVQILRTAEALRARGHDVELNAEPQPSFAGFDIVHLFHLDRLWENGSHVRRLERSNVPVVLSTIWWPTDEFDAAGRSGLQGTLARTFGASAVPTLKIAQRSFMSWSRSGGAWSQRPVLGFERAARRLLERCAVILPNSEAEARAIRERFGLVPRVVVVPNAADSDFFTAGEGRERRGVVCVGRIEPRKNQLTLIEALHGTQIPLTIIGRAGVHAAEYERRCRAAAGPEVEFCGALDREGVRHRLRGARVHVAPSWYETPGLASLEAALCGCRVVVTSGGCTSEYFAGDATYAEPADGESLRQAVERALEAAAEPLDASRLRQAFTWQAAATATERAYGIATGG